MIRRRLPDLLAVALLFILPLLVFWPQTMGGRTLLPTENLYQYEPFAAYRAQVGAPDVPHNALLSDLVLENYQWKSFIRQSIAQGELPLWNPYQFSGLPFLASGQQSTLYPFSLIYYVLPLTAAYGWFTVVQLWLAGAFLYAFTRGLGVNRIGGLVAGIVYQLSAFFVISAVFPMIIAAAAWLPLILLMAEFVIQQRPALRGRPATIPWVAIGALALGCNVLAGHVEITYYTLIITAYYAAARLLTAWWRNRGTRSERLKWVRSDTGMRMIELQTWRHWAKRAFWLAMMVVLGLGIGTAQFIPLFELAGQNFRSGSASYEQIVGWAHPARDVLQFLMPNFYGSPAHHSYFDVFTGQFTPATVNSLNQPINTIDWGIKNYVEGALYLGILPLALAGYALVDSWLKRRGAMHRAPTTPPYRLIFLILALAGLTFMFGLPVYRLLYLLPGINQLHSPFRWIFAVTFSVAALAGFGADALATSRGDQNVPVPHNPDVDLQVMPSARNPSSRLAKRFGWALIWLGAAALAALLVSRLLYAQIAPLVERVFSGMAKAPEAFADARMFYSYEFRNVLLFGLFTVCAGIVLRVSRCPIYLPRRLGRRPVWELLAVVVIALDLMAASWDFNPASDPKLLDFTPPAIQWLMQQPGQWRYTTLDDPTQSPIMQANVGMSYGLHDIRGYESIIPKQYADFMQQLAPQVQLDYNRVAPIYLDHAAALESPLLDLLNVRYVMTHKSADVQARGWSLAYEDDAVKIWQRDYTVLPNDVQTTLTPLPHAYTVASDAFDAEALTVPKVWTAADVVSDSGRELFIHATTEGPSWLVVSQSYFPGWRAYIHAGWNDSDQETAATIQRVQGNFVGVSLPDADQGSASGQWTVRLVYSPSSFQVGLFGAFISIVLLVFALGIWLWRLYIAAGAEANTTTRVAKNSVAPIILNLFNRGIDFAFALVMLRILGPSQAGIYTYAGVIFVWFDIFTNFGLNLFLTREVARDRSRAGRLLFNTSALRLILALVGVPLLLGFLGVRQSAVEPPLAAEALAAIGLLYIGLLPNSLSTGLSALFYAFEKAEIPAAVATVATICKAMFGLAALIMGFGVVGLAGVSILTNCITLAVLVYNGRGLLRAPASEGRGEPPVRPYKPNIKLMRSMVRKSWPLMLNHFLATIFFQIDVVLIEGIHGETMVGQYSVAYKWVMALNIIPSFFTQALLPVMARQAHEDREALKRNYRLAVKLLVSVALPLAVLFTFLAYFLTGILGGSQYLPDGAIATQLMIWSIPVGWVNSLTQYVLIALDMQRRITLAFFLGVAFNIIANLIFIPTYGYQAAAIITILSEVALIVPFGLLLREALGSMNWLDIIWRPLVAAAAMLVVMVVGWQAQPVLALVVAALIYPAILLALRPFSPDEISRLSPLFPSGLRRLMGRFAARFTAGVAT